MAAAAKKAPGRQATEEQAQAIAEMATLAMQIEAAKRLQRNTSAKKSLVGFTRLTMPDPADPDNPDASRYHPVKHHLALGEALQALFKGDLLRLIITMPPRHGKTELASRRFPAWVLGQEPYWEIVQASYNQDFADEIGRDVREVLQARSYQQIFPGTRLRKGSKAADRLGTMEGGGAVFVGRGGALTGRGADVLIIDDPLKDRKEADSKTIRDDLWKWFNDVAMTRLKDDGARVIIIMTRWHEDDLVGRLIDPKNDYYDGEEAEKWHILDLPALARENDPLGRAPGAALWPEKFGETYLHGIRRQNPRGFAALYQGRPTPEEGNFFRAEWIATYRQEDLPPNDRLRFYCASDHAVSTKQDNDKTCLMVVGVDEEDTIWVMPDVFWRRVETDVTVEAMIDMMERRKPLTWWAESEHIGKSIGPFLRKRMAERKIYAAIEMVVPAKDKMTRAQPIQGRMAMRKVKFPAFAPWWTDAKDELLKFPQAQHDDFVDALAHIGAGLSRLVAGPRLKHAEKSEPETGTIGWIKWAADRERKHRKLMTSIGGF